MFSRFVPDTKVHWHREKSPGHLRGRYYFAQNGDETVTVMRFLLYPPRFDSDLFASGRELG